MKVLFFGTPHFSCPVLSALIASPDVQIVAVVTQPDKPRGRGMESSFSPVKEIAVQNAIPVLQPRSCKKELSEFLTELRKFGPIDVGIVVAFGQILPVEILQYPKAGSINIHASLLPRWRGAAPIQRAIMAGDPETGVCLMQMEAGLDTGPVFSEARTVIGKTETASELHDRLSEIGAELLIKNLRKIVSGEITSVQQSDTGVTHAAKITLEEAQLSFERPARDLANCIRGLSSSPGAWTTLSGKKLKILNASCKEAFPNDSSVPGSVSFLDAHSLEITCKPGVLSVTELQLEGKKRLKIADFLRGCKVEKETRFGG